MHQSMIIEVTIQAMILVLVLSLPPVIVAAASGILVSLVQAVTQVQEQTLSFAVKLIAVFVTIVLTARWLGSELYTYAVRLFDTFPEMLP